MGKGIKEEARAPELEPVSLSELIHQHVRAAIETAVREELRAVLGTNPYERRDGRPGGVADAFARRPRRDLRLPRWLCPSCAECRTSSERSGTGRGRRPA